ncbi:g5621 [Coccomyxa elongata]
MILCSIEGVLLERPRRPVKPKLLYVGVQAAAAALAADGMSSAKAALGQVLRRNPSPKISKSDEAFEKMGVEFVWGYSDLNLDELNDLFSRVGFPARNPEKLVRALAHTHRTLWIRSTRKSRFASLGQLLGFCRATSDGALSATIWDVAVHPAWQRSGLGRGVLERLTARLVAEGIPNITLFAEPNVVGLYEKLGFIKDPGGVKGLAFQGKLPAAVKPLMLL